MRGTGFGAASARNARSAMRRLSRLCLLACLLPASAFAAVSDAPAGLLRFTPEGVLLSVDIALGNREVRFKTEPAYEGDDLLRAAIPLGQNQTEFVGFAWDKTAGRLYVDTNRNLDLTDDSGSPYRPAAANGPLTVFENVRLTIERNGIPLEYVLQVRLGSEWMSDVLVVSGWQGRVTFGETEFEVTVVDNLDGALGQEDQFYLTVPGEASEASARAQLDDLFIDSIAWGVPGHLAVAGATYAVDTAFEMTEQGVAVRARFLSPQEPLAEVRIQGKYIRELVLADQNASVCLVYTPGDRVRLPAGMYSVNSALLEDGWELGYPRNGNAYRVTTERPATLPVGGPLRQRITAERHVNRLDLSLEVTGAGGLPYSRNGQFAAPAQFAVYRGDSQVHTGTFEYG